MSNHDTRQSTARPTPPGSRTWPALLPAPAFCVARTLACVLLAALILPAAVWADPNGLTIYEIQFTDDPAGQSPYAGQVIDCLGGIVTHKFPGSRPRLVIQDPDQTTGWAAIQVKDWLSGAPLFNQADIGDRISLTNVYVEEYVGNTFLQCWGSNDPALTVHSTDNPLPAALAVDPADILAPVQVTPAEAYVADHLAEKYEAMRLVLTNVIVTDIDLGKATDNYRLQEAGYASDPDHSCWAADYMNADITAPYHALVIPGQRFCRIQGILEQYTNLSNGWDYYQLLTTATEDFAVAPTADLTCDCRVDLRDFDTLAQYWLADDCTDPNWCAGADLTQDTFVDTIDAAAVGQQWLNQE